MSPCGGTHSNVEKKQADRIFTAARLYICMRADVKVRYAPLIFHVNLLPMCFTAIIPAIRDVRDTIHTGAIIDTASAEPAAARSAIIVVGTS